MDRTKYVPGLTYYILCRAVNTSALLTPAGRDVGAVQTDGAGEADGGINSAWMRRHLSDSIYLWACGEKADHDDDDIKLSDRLTGWIILFVSEPRWRVQNIDT